MPKITNTQERHNTLVGGIPIWPRTGTGHRGTLTAVARRNTPNKERVLVTNPHAVSNRAHIPTRTLSGPDSHPQRPAADSNKAGRPQRMECARRA